MTDKQLHKLSRRELLEMLLEQSKEIDRLETQVQKLENALSDRDIELEKAGSIAEASLKLNGVFEAAQRAADQYLANIRRLNAETEAEYRQSVVQTRAQCERELFSAERQTPGERA